MTYDKWSVLDTLTGIAYPQPNKLIAEKVAEMHGNCEVIPGWGHPEREPEYEYAVKMGVAGIVPAYSEARARTMAERDIRYKTGRVVRRVKAGPWEEVP